MAKKNKNNASRKVKKIEKLKEDLQIKDDEILSQEDYANLAFQCEKFQNAANVGMVNSSIAKFAVYYRKQWFFVTYNRDKQKVGSCFDISFLEPEEHAAFLRFKNRIEVEARKKIMLNAPELKPTVKIQNASIKLPEEKPAEEEEEA